MKRILFVDDEPHILDGLKRMLRPFRHLWHTEFVDSGTAALAAFGEQPFDVVVTDMRMTGMDGATLLKEVQARSPRTVRIVLSGQADLEAALRSVCVSHQYVAKPCDAVELRSVIERACNLESLLHDPAVQKTLGNVGDLPVLPRTYKALVEALGEAEVDLARVGAIVGSDLGISAKILQLVNSSFFGIRREITSIVQATAYLGTSTIRDLVLSAEVFKRFEGSAVPAFSLEREQRHSLLTARIARFLLDDPVQAEEAFLAGMLHDVGKLVMAAYLTDSMGRILEAGAGVTETFHSVEKKLLGVTHAEIGAYLLALWGMPYRVVEAVAHHHEPSRVLENATFGVLTAVHVAACLVDEVVLAPAGAKLDEELLARLGLAERLPAWRAQANEEVGNTGVAA